MASLVNAIADAVVTRLNAGPFSQSFTAARSYIPDYTIEALESLTVTVVASEQSSSRLSRATNKRMVVIDVAIQKRAASDTDRNTMMDLVEEILGVFLTFRPLASSTYWCSNVENRPVFDPKHLREKEIFTSVLRLTFNKET